MAGRAATSPQTPTRHPGRAHKPRGSVTCHPPAATINSAIAAAAIRFLATARLLRTHPDGTLPPRL
jgi:hypothetical protein